MDGIVLAFFLLAAFAGGFASGLAGFAMGFIVAGVWLHILTPLQTTTLIVGYGLLTQTRTLPDQPSHAQEARGQDSERPDQGRSDVRDLKFQPGHAVHAGDDRHDGPKRPEEAPCKHRKHPPSFEQPDAARNKLRA